MSFTTSPSARSGDLGEESDVKGDDGKPLCNKIRFWQERSFINKILWLIYKVMRFWYVVFYFYFYPLGVMFINLIACFAIARSSAAPTANEVAQVEDDIKDMSKLMIQ